MTVYKDSRYAFGKVNHLSLEKAGKVYSIVRYVPRAATITSLSKLHNCVYGDRLDQLAETYYGDHRLWWKIAEANPALKTLHILKPGETVLIP